MLTRFSIITAILFSLFVRPAAAQTTQTSRTRTGSLTVADQCVVLGVNGMGTGGVQVTGTYAGTISFTVSIDGVNYAAVDVAPPSDQSATVNSTTSTGLWSGAVASAQWLRACMTAYTSGTAVVTLSSSLSGGGGGGAAGTFEGEVTVGAQPETDPHYVKCSDGSAAAPCNVAVTSIAVGDNNIGNVDVVSSALPTNAATEAKQPALGTAGTPSADVITVQGRAAMTPLLVDGSATTQPVSGTVTVTATNLDIQSGGADLATVAKQPAFGTAGTSSADVLTVQGRASMTPISANVFFGGTAAATDTGNLSAQVQRITLALDDPAAVALTGILAATEETNSNFEDLVGALNGDVTHNNTVNSKGPQTMYEYNSAPVAVTTGFAVRAQASDKGEAYDVIRDAAGNGRGANVNASNELLVASTNAALTKIDTQMVAHDAADAGNAVKVGAVAETSVSGATMVADGDRTNLYSGADGILYVRPHAPLEDILQDRATNTDGASTAFAGGLAAPGANIRIWLSSCTFANSSATAVTVDIRDGSAGSVLWTFPVPANVSGATHTWAVPLKFTANTAVAYDGSAAATTVTVSCNGFKSKL